MIKPTPRTIVLISCLLALPAITACDLRGYIPREGKVEETPTATCPTPAPAPQMQPQKPAPEFIQRILNEKEQPPVPPAPPPPPPAPSKKHHPEPDVLDAS